MHLTIKVLFPFLQDFYHAQMLDGNLCDFLSRNIAHVGKEQLYVMMLTLCIMKMFDILYRTYTDCTGAI